jgi:hypothetical protein
MACVLLIDSGQPYLAELATALERNRHWVKFQTPNEQLFEGLDAHGTSSDILIVDLSRDREKDWKVLERVQGIFELKMPAPVILGISVVYRGPQMRLRAQELGARFCYVR